MIKRLLISLIFLLPVLCFSQTGKYTDNILYGKKENRMAVFHALGIPNDTANIAALPDSIKRKPHLAAKGNTLYLWDTVLYKWSVYLAGVTDTHLGNANLTQTANRTYSGGNFTYTFNNVGTWQWNYPNSIVSFSDGAKTITAGDGASNTTLQMDYGLLQFRLNGPDIYSELYADNISAESYLWTYNKAAILQRSFIRYKPEMISLEPWQGELFIDSLDAGSATDSVLVWNKSTGKAGYRDAASFGSTPTLQQVLDAGSTLTDAEIILTGANNFAFSGSTSVISLIQNSASTGTAPTLLNLNRQTTGTATNNIGSAIEYNIENAAGGSITSNKLLSRLTNVSAGSETSNFYLIGLNAAAVENYMIVEPDYIIYNNGVDTASSRAYARSVAGGGSGTDNANVGSGYRWLKPGTQEIKTAFGVGISIDSSSNTDGLTFKVDSSVALDPSFTTNKRTQKILDSLQAAGWGNQSVNNDYRYYIDMSGSTHANGFFSSTGTGSGAAVIAAAVDGWFYGRDLQTGTTTTGRAYCLSQTGNYNIISINSSFRYSAGVKIQIPILSDGTETFGVMFGFMDDVNNFASVVDGFGFRYLHSDSSGTFIAWTKSNGTVTEDATDITVAANTNYNLQTYCIGGVAYFYINGVLKASIATNVPSGTARATSLGMSIYKSAGTTSRHMYVNTFGYDWRDN